VAIVDEGQLLALDTPAALRARAPGGTLVELTLDGDAAPSVALVQAIPHVTDVSARDGVLRVYSDRGGQIIPSLIDTVQSGGRTVNNINLAAPSLETLFLSLTGKRLD
jgi:ABC-2 type transport system ATP-binding protein